MFIHHLATLALLTLSFTTQMHGSDIRYWLPRLLLLLYILLCVPTELLTHYFHLQVSNVHNRIGSLVILVHDFADHWMELAKMAKYAGLNVKFKTLYYSLHFFCRHCVTLAL